MTFQTQVHYEINDALFTKNEKGLSGVRLIGTLTVNSTDLNLLSFFLIPIRNGNWRIIGLTETYGLNRQVKQQLAQKLVNHSKNILGTINLWAGKQQENTGRAVINQYSVPDKELATNSISFRTGMLNLKHQTWSSMWRRIEDRIKHDPFLRAHGYNNEDLKNSLIEIKKYFSWEWTKSIYANALDNNEPLMTDTFSPEDSTSWFPAYHLARLACGAICVDPGVNYLIEIGLSLRELQGFEKTKSLASELVRSPGTRHHLCMAAELYKQGYLTDLEPETGSGGATNDLLVVINNHSYSIEVKEFISQNPVKTLLKELEDKSNKLPNKPEHPVIFHIVLRELEVPDVKKEKEFIENVDSIIDRIPKKISAIVIGERFSDASGGRIKRKTTKILINPNANHNAIETDLELLFQNNYEKLILPTQGIGTFFTFDNGNPEETEEVKPSN